MVKIVDVVERESSVDKKKFYSLILQGGMELVLSEESGRYYATAKRASISTTFDEATARSFIGRELRGKIVRVTCDPYEYTVKETGEVLKLSHRWVFNPNESASMEEAIFDKEPAKAGFEF